jgi:hypothetical protein
MNQRSGGKDSGRNVTGFLLIAVPSAVVLVLLILAVPYYAGASARISSLYTNLAAPADRAVTADLAGYSNNMHSNLAAAKLYLQKQVQAETSFDNQLGDITFPPAPDPHVDLLIAADQKRIKLIKLQMQAKALRKLRAYNAQDLAANAIVEEQVKIIRQDLGLPPAPGNLY